ncbi:uncharacterized protein LOC131234581 [Magnolia sinica]|uniref:uncharacterized protein LOC131234581 n=1 Tax=Magnolia sinica TaxID=86752 RepID=UPI00265A8D4B|nr:uncharacterized protein LOC131234581 [Magnolia sinica]
MDDIAVALASMLLSKEGTRICYPVPGIFSFPSDANIRETTVVGISFYIFGISEAFDFQDYDPYLPFLLDACNDESSDVRQAIVYGIGVCAEFGGSVFKPLVGEALSRLNFVMRQPNALHSDNVMAYDNVVSTLGKICQFHRDSIDAA